MAVLYQKNCFSFFIYTILVILSVFIFDSMRSYRACRKDTTVNSESLIRDLIQNRNEVSRKLNMHQQQIGKMECERNSSKGVSTSGGWCQKASYENSGQHKTDLSLAKQLSIFLQDKVASGFGDGPGRYKQILDSTGLLNGYDAYDGAPFCNTTSKGIVKYLDLTIPQYGIPIYDWIISLEVAEHIPKIFEDTYIDNIVRHAAEGIILSWAVPGQGGFSHVNNRPLKYVEELLSTLGFYRDIQNSSLLQSSSTLPWLKRNINVYRRLQFKNKHGLYAFA